MFLSKENLKKIYINHNPLIKIPKNINEMPNLQELHINKYSEDKSNNENKKLTNKNYDKSNNENDDESNNENDDELNNENDDELTNKNNNENNMS